MSGIWAIASYIICTVTLQGCNRDFHSKFHGPYKTTNGKLDCGAGVDLCGVLALETGTANGVYSHDEPVVHGLWPQTGNYGTSSCKPPHDQTPPNQIYACYQQKGVNNNQLIGFERHEWTNHGMCSGASSEADYFGQVCNIAEGPLKVMTASRQKGADLQATGTALTGAGYFVFSLQPHTNEILLTACAGADGKWKLASPQDFSKVCGSGTPGKPDDHPNKPDDHPAVGQCVSGQHGPACSSDAECQSVNGCLRCANSGFCTDQPLRTEIFQ